MVIILRISYFQVVTAGGRSPRIRLRLHARARPRDSIVRWLANKVSGSAEMRGERSGYGRRMKQRHHFSLSSRAGKLSREHVIARQTVREQAKPTDQPTEKHTSMPCPPNDKSFRTVAVGGPSYFRL
jgi:hypothetical protein